MNEKTKIVGIDITLDVKMKYFRIMDYDNINYYGSVGGSYEDKDDLIRIISNYIKDYVSVDFREVDANNE